VVKYNEVYTVRCDLHLPLLTLHNEHIPRVGTLPRVILVFFAFSEWSL